MTTLIKPPSQVSSRLGFNRFEELKQVFGIAESGLLLGIRYWVFVIEYGDINKLQQRRTQIIYNK
jgi:hypothetical protein